jgi:hypothetical protein
MRNPLALSCALALVLGAGGTGAAGDGKATDVLTAARKAIGDKTLEALKTLSIEASVQRNVGTLQVSADVEILLELPDKYLRSEVGSGPMSMTMSSGFVGERAIRPANATAMAGGAMIIRLGPGGPMPGEKPSAAEQERIDQLMLRNARADISRLMLGWFGSTHPALPAEYTYAGEAESPDGKADVIDAKNADGFSARLFVDRATHLPLMVTYQGAQPRMLTVGGPPGGAPGRAGRGGPGGEPGRELSEQERAKAREAAEKEVQELRSQPPVTIEFTLFFDDWREVAGIRFPHKIRRASAGATNEEWTVGKVRVNPRIDAKKFEG